jgi:hypothetical protein
VKALRRICTALALIGWYLIAPPREGWIKDNVGDFVAPPVMNWIRLGTFDSEENCQTALAQLRKEVLRAYAKEKAEGRHELVIGDAAECIASDNPVLKGH